jgi:spore maturation protein CgeB
VDEEKFNPRHEDKGPFGNIYTGSVYKKRREFLDTYPEIRTLAAYRDYDTVEEYADAISRSKVVLNLPSLSEASNTRTFEVLASKTALITPAMLYPDSLFEHGKHLLYYQGNPSSSFEEVKKAMNEIAQQGYEEVLRKHTIKHRLRTVLDIVGSRPLRFARKR